LIFTPIPGEAQATTRGDRRMSHSSKWLSLKSDERVAANLWKLCTSLFFCLSVSKSSISNGSNRISWILVLH